jgi:hypothetical protein
MSDDEKPPIRTFSGTHDFHPTVLADTDAHDAGTAARVIIAASTFRPFAGQTRCPATHFDRNECNLTARVS